MSEHSKAVQAVRNSLGQFQPILERHRGILGDGSGNVGVTGRPGYVNIRPRSGASVTGNIEALMVRADIPPIEGYPIIFGKDYDTDYYQVLCIDYSQSMEWLSDEFIRGHHTQHEMPDGFDITWIQKQQIIPMLAHPTDPATMTIKVESDYFAWHTEWKFFAGEISEDLTARVATTSADFARFVLVSIDGATNTLVYENGDEFFIQFPPSQTVSIPAPSSGLIPVVAVYLPFGTTSLDWDNVYDVRLLFSGGGYMSVGAAPRDAAYVVATTHADLTADRTLVSGVDTTVTDGGAKGNILVDREGDIILLFKYDPDNPADPRDTALQEYSHTEAGLRASLGAMELGDVTWLPPGVLRLTSTTLTLLNGSTIIGRSRNSSIIQVGTPGTPVGLPTTLLEMGDISVLEGIWIISYIDSGNDAIAILMSSSAGVVRGCEISCQNVGGGDAYAIVVDPGYLNNLIEDTYVYAGIVRVNVSDTTLRNVRVTDVVQIRENTKLLHCQVGTLEVSNSATATVIGGTYTSITVAAGSTVSLNSVDYGSIGGAGTITQRLGDRAGKARDEIISGDWNVNAGELGLPAGVAFPGAPDEGDIYYRSDEDKAYIYNGVVWALLAYGSGAGAGSPVVQVGGALVTTTGVGGVYVVTANCDIAAVYIYCKENGSAGSTIVDVHKDGVTIFTNQANRPELAHDDPDNVAKSGVPDITTAVEGEVLSVDIDQIATGAGNLTVVIATSSDAGTVEVQQDDAKILDASIINFEGDGITVTDEGGGKGTVDIAVEIQEDDVKVLDASTINFEGGGSKVTDEGGGKATVSIPGAWALIEEQVFVGGAASALFNAIPQTYRALMLLIEARTDNASHVDNVVIRFNGDAGAANYIQTELRGNNNSPTAAFTAANANIVVAEAAQSRASSFGYGKVTIPHYARADREKKAFGVTNTMGDGVTANEPYIINRAVQWLSTAAITAIALTPLGGANFVTGSIFTLYGIT